MMHRPPGRTQTKRNPYLASTKHNSHADKTQQIDHVAYRCRASTTWSIYHRAGLGLSSLRAVCTLLQLYLHSSTDPDHDAPAFCHPYVAVRHVCRCTVRNVPRPDTSLTNFLAFMLGSTTSLPAVEYFCFYAATGILFDFFLQARKCVRRVNRAAVGVWPNYAKAFLTPLCLTRPPTLRKKRNR